jgi:peptide/nickel transport system substrate-binding protein
MYTLKSFSKYALGEPYISELRIKFYSNEEELIKAYKRRRVDNINSISPNKARELEEDGAHIISYPLPRVFGVFFNQNQANLFANKEVRVALETALDKEMIVKEILNEYGTGIDGPIPPGISIRRKADIPEDEAPLTRVQKAEDVLIRNGWEKAEDGIMIKETRKEDFRLNFSISTSNAPELKQAANIIKVEWEKIGAEVEVKFFESGVLNQDIIRPRKYDSLLFGEIIGRDLDLFAFWHSSQRNDPGLNIALYANITVDKLLEDIRASSDNREKMDKYQELEKEISNDIPAIFLYSPDFIYATSDKIKGLKLGIVTIPSERFLNIHEWHTRTEKVWTIFAK